MRYLITILLFAIFIISCDSTKSTVKSADKERASTSSDTVRIANESLDYELIIFEPGFYTWLETQPPKEHYSLSTLEIWNRLYVLEYNHRVFSPAYPKDLYSMEINYDPSIRYGLEVNYLLYNYFRFFEITYNQKLR